MCVIKQTGSRITNGRKKTEHHETGFAMFHLTYYLHLLQKKINMTNLKRRTSHSKIIFYHNRTTSKRGVEEKKNQKE